MTRRSDSPTPDRGALRLDEFLPFRLSLASNAISNLIAERYASLFALKMTEWRVIAVLGEEDALTQQEIGLRTKLDKVTVSRAARALQERKLIGRMAHEDDGRSARLNLTPQGRSLYEAVAPSALDVENTILSEFRADEIATLMDLLRRLEAAAEAHDGDAPRIPSRARRSDL